MGDNRRGQKLFREHMRDVRRLTDSEHRAPEKPRPEPVAHQRKADQQAVLEELARADPSRDDIETGEELAWCRPGLQLRELRRLRRGYFSIQEELDLHGYIVREAHARLAEFLDAALQRGLRCVRVIHGKGRGSPGPPVLKGKVDHWLRQRDSVLAFTSAPPKEGGTGAVLVLLRAR
ncbi:MAG: Smr/MutS family protein [Gammaproteobacteria bacterium]|nr:Smr/MutS family protein [Gammaproteobacteria bacterium]